MTEPAFDGVASDYDRQFTHTETGRRQRDLVRNYLKNHVFPSNRPFRVLELNCGTGADAIWMAEQGAQVLATDLSPEMVAVARAKPGADAVTFVAGDLRDVLTHTEGQFDLVFSNFGGLNCISRSEMEAFCRHLPDRLKADGRFIGVIMARYCVWESLYFLAKFRWGQAFRRAGKGPIQAPLGDGQFQPTWYYSPKQMKQIFSQNWKLQATLPIGFFLPPSYLDPFFKKRPRLMQKMIKLDSYKQGNYKRSAFSDHFLIDFGINSNGQE